MSLVYKIIKWVAYFTGQQKIDTPKNFERRAEFILPDFVVKKINGQEFHLKNLRGKKVLLVNVASKCGYTPQYPELEKLYKENENKLMIIGFPSN